MKQRESKTSTESWDQEQLFFDGDEFFENVIGAIDSAQTSVDVESYIFEPDEVGTRVIDALDRAHARGVHVRLLIDGLGSLRWVKTRPSPSFPVRIFHPVKFQLRRLLRFLFRLNQRDHRKLWIIDGKRAWVGSMNVSRHHLRSLSGERAWRDTAIAVEGPAGLARLQHAFDYAWQRSYRLEQKGLNIADQVKKIKGLFSENPPPTSLVRLNFTPALRLTSGRDWRRRIAKARARVWLTNPYFAPSPLLLKALLQARRHEADVIILIPRLNDVFFMPWISRSYYHILLKAGIRVYEYQPRFLHAKSALIDDWAVTGTSNLNTRTSRHDLEVDLVITHPETHTLLLKQWQLDLSQSVDIQASHHLGINIGRFLERMLGNVIGFILKDWI